MKYFAANEGAQGCLQKNERRLAGQSQLCSDSLYYTATISCKSLPLVQRTYRCILAVAMGRLDIVAHNGSMTDVERSGLCSVLGHGWLATETIRVSVFNDNAYGRARFLISSSSILTGIE